MKISVIGSGNMGSGFVKLLSSAGHSVFVTARDKAKATDVAKAHGATVVDAKTAATAEVIVLATGYADAVNALQSLGNLNGKVVIDITNPLTADYMGLTIGHNTSAAEEIVKVVPGIKLVKAFNTVFAQVLAGGAQLPSGEQVQVFVAADDSAAKKTVTNLATQLGFKAIDAGTLKNARYLEAVAGFNIFLGYGAGLGTSIAPSWSGLNPAPVAEVKRSWWQSLFD
jgi:predicted dinucleotide-binding enzyme